MQNPFGELSEDLRLVARDLCASPRSERGLSDAILRAIAFFELQSRILSPDDKEFQAQVRTAAAMKFIEFIETNILLNKSGRHLNLGAYRALTNIALAGGWSGLRRQPSSRALDQKIRELRRRSEVVALVVDLIYRFQIYEKASKLSGGTTMAMAVVSKVYGKGTPSNVSASPKTISNRISGAGEFAIFQYLLKRFQQWAPLRLRSKTFASDLLGQSRQPSMLRLFNAYQDIGETTKNHLRTQTFTRAQFTNEAVDLKAPGFSERERRAIKDHYKVRGKRLKF